MEYTIGGIDDYVEKKQYDVLNLIRLIASIFVVLIHCPFDGQWGGMLFQ